MFYKGVRNETTKTWEYAPEFRQQMVELVKAGRKVSELAREFGCHETTITGWVRQAHADQIGGIKPDAPLTTTEWQELSLLRRQLRQVQMERDILAKATAWSMNQECNARTGTDGKTTLNYKRESGPKSWLVNKTLPMQTTGNDFAPRLQHGSSQE